jgi:hypothetical protein
MHARVTQSRAPVNESRKDRKGARAPVAQLDRASDFGSEGWRFEPFRARCTGLIPVHGFRFFWPSARQIDDGARAGPADASVCPVSGSRRRAHCGPACEKRPSLVHVGRSRAHGRNAPLTASGAHRRRAYRDAGAGQSTSSRGVGAVAHLADYCDRERVGIVLDSAADLELIPGFIAQPDIVVIPHPVL